MSVCAHDPACPGYGEAHEKGVAAFKEAVLKVDEKVNTDSSVIPAEAVDASLSASSDSEVEILPGVSASPTGATEEDLQAFADFVELYGPKQAKTKKPLRHLRGKARRKERKRLNRE